MRDGRCSKPTPKGWPISAAATSGLDPWADDRGHKRVAPDLRLIEVLTRHGVPFVVVGGHAVNFHGSLRATEDTDILWIRSPDTEATLLAALREVDAQFIGDEIDPATGIERTYPITESFVRSGRLMMLCTTAGFLDLFDYVPGFPDEPVATVWNTAVKLDGVRFASLEWLRRMKQAAGRPKDLLDLENLPEPN
jgi:hypothetical protein